MNDQSTPPASIWALLVGIDCYMGHTIQGLPNYGNLGGCVSDVLLMDDFLRTRLQVPDERIIKLTASGSGSKPREAPEQWPTKANIVAAFQDLTQRAQKGDQVYIHYAGHGGRAVTLFPSIKGDDGLDESLVPTDYGQIENVDEPEDRYIRDLELAALLQKMVDKKLIVTIVLDSCHAGGATRAATTGDTGTAVRGSGEVDKVPRTPSKLVATRRKLMAGWQKQTRGTRSAQLAGGWLPNPEGYTLISACRALELATEYTLPTGKRHGYLSYWLWETLQKPMLNWEMVHQQVVSRVYGLNRTQTPQLQGVGERAVFGGATLALPTGVNVLAVNNERLRLDVGLAGGVGVGAQFFVYPSGVTNFNQIEQRLAVVEVVESKETEAWAKVLRQLRSDAIIPGAQALLFDPGASQQRSVRLVSADEAAVAGEADAFAALTAALAQSESRFVRLAASGETADFQVAITPENAYVIRDGTGQPLPNLDPVPINNPGEIAYRLIHLTKYHNILNLGSPDALSRLAGKLEVKLMAAPDQPFDSPGGIPTIKSREQIYYLHIRNLFEPMDSPPSDAGWYIEALRLRTMNITVLNLDPEWGISRIIPALGEGADQVELGPGETLLLPRIDLPGQPMQLPAFASLVPPGADEAIDIFKVFATTDTTSSYNTLQLPKLTEGARASLVGARLQEPERNWITAQVQVRVTR